MNAGKRCPVGGVWWDWKSVVGGVGGQRMEVEGSGNVDGCTDDLPPTTEASQLPHVVFCPDFDARQAGPLGRKVLG